MEYLEDFKDIFNTVATDDSADCATYKAFMSQTSSNVPGSNLDTKDISGINMNKDQYESPEVEFEFKQVKHTDKSPVMKPTTEPISLTVIDNDEITGELSEADKKELQEMANHDYADDWEKESIQAMNTFKKNIKNITDNNNKVTSCIKTTTEPTTKNSFPKIKSEPAFLEVKKIQPITKTPSLHSQQNKTINTVETSKQKVGSIKPTSSTSDFNKTASDAVKKCRARIDKMESMNGYDDKYKNRCAYLLSRFSDLPEAKFESMCQYMESIH